jgi:hypothetical protein
VARSAAIVAGAGFGFAGPSFDRLRMTLEAMTRERNERTFDYV